MSTPPEEIGSRLQGYLAHKKLPPPRTLNVPQAYAYGPRGVLGGWAFSYGRATPAEALATHTEFTRNTPSVEPTAAADGTHVSGLTNASVTRPPSRGATLLS